MVDYTLLSSALGYLSILCWLGAQFPQVIVNIRTKSVEGLALPFLANWLFGDITNLVGCILTHQLPFQTYLASYFVFVDMSLVAQYIYYYKPPPSSSPSPTLSPSSSRSASVAMTVTPTAAVHSPRNLTRPSSRTPLLVGELEAGYRTYHARARSQTGSSRFSGVMSAYPPAGLLPSSEEVKGKGKGRREGSRASHASLGNRVEKAVEDAKDEDKGGKREEEDELSAMTESFYSDLSAAAAAAGAGGSGGGGGNGTGLNRHVSWSRSLADSPVDSTPGENTPRQGMVSPSRPTTSRNPDLTVSTSASAASLTPHQLQPRHQKQKQEQEQEKPLTAEDRKRSRSRGRASRRSRPTPLLVYAPAPPLPGPPGPATDSGHSEEGGVVYMNLDQDERGSGSRRRRSASIVFLGVGFGALLVFGGAGGTGAGENSALGESTVSRGRVLNWDTDPLANSPWESARTSDSRPRERDTPPVPVPSNDPSPASPASFIDSPPIPRPPPQPASSPPSPSSSRSFNDPFISIASFMASFLKRRRDRRPHDPPPLTPEQKRRLIGRISAWACTTLYLTSRLPQIWKNYTRKSVQGLSLALFVFAFLGNTFYVASILSSPVLWEYPPDNHPISATILSSTPLFTPEPPYNSPRARALLRESLPYLLGSGGTLLFDIVIVTQGIIYGRRERLLGDDDEEEEIDDEDEEMGDADGENSDEEADKRTLAVLPPAPVGVGAGDDGLRPGSDARM